MAVVNHSRFRGQSSVFYLTGWGHAGDHWLSKALNAHPEIFVLNCYEPARIKYFSDGEGRGFRPDIVTMTAFLEDIGTDYKAIGECHAYRSTQLRPLREKYGDTVPDANLLRHPYTWLDFYIRHRANNCRMPGDWSGALEHEWRHANHALFRRLGLPEYDKKQVDVWAAFQGMWLMHNVLGDLRHGSRQVRIEDVTTRPEALNELTAYLTKGACAFTPALFDIVYDFAKLDYRGEETYVDPEAAWESWPEWKRAAFDVLVPGQVKDAYESVGYRLHRERPSRFAEMKHLSDANAKEPPIVFVSMMKSGTWLMREVLAAMTGLAPHDPKPAVTEADYADPEMVDIRPGTFLSSHLEASPEVCGRLRNAGAKVVFLHRNVGDILLSLHHHFLNDVDKCVGSSAGNDAFLASLPEDEALSLMITGFDVHPHHWEGAKLFFRQMRSWLDFAKEWPVHFVSYEDLLLDKPGELARLRAFLGEEAKNGDIEAIVAATGFDAMRDKAAGQGKAGHFRRGKAGEHLSRFSRHHFHLLETMMRQFDPDFEGRYAKTPYTDFYFLTPMVREFRLLVERLDELRQAKGKAELRVAVFGKSLLRKKLALMARPGLVVAGLADHEGNAAPANGVPGVDAAGLAASGADCVVCFGCGEAVRQAVEQAAAKLGVPALLRAGGRDDPEWLVM